jgi:hypothetical protein
MRPSLRHKAPGSLSQGSNRQEFVSPGSGSRRVVSLGHCLLLGQRSRFNLFPDYIRSLFHQHHRNPHTELSRHRDNSHLGGYVSRMPAGDRAKEFPQLSVLADGRPGSLDELTSQPWVTAVGDRSPIGSLSGGVLSRDQTQEACQLAAFLIR